MADDEKLQLDSKDVLIHDLGNHLTVALGHVKILIKRIESGKEPSQEDILARLGKTLESLDRINARLGKERAQVSKS
ncbi:MAG: hypothetical protein OXT67_09375 [Zetaproteobacteria bacterium]|nr:hypothetical protein [Zetaproteobacteria bacterium]